MNGFENNEGLQESLGAFFHGAVTMASCHLGFDLLDPKGLTEEQANQFHAFVKPLMEKTYARVKDDDEKEREFERTYNTSSPTVFLMYLLTDEMIAQEKAENS